MSIVVIVVCVSDFFQIYFSVPGLCHLFSSRSEIDSGRDGRCDSPGYSAKYGTYSLMHTATNLIIDFQLTQCTETTSSVAMEKHGLEKVLQ